MKRRRKTTKSKDERLLVPCGVTMLNLCCSNSIEGAFQTGRIITIPGGSASGKTVLVLTTLAEVCKHQEFDDYDLIYDDAEFASAFNIPKLFGQSLADRISAPKYGKQSNPVFSNTIQDFKMFVTERAAKSKKPFIWFLDSLDSLTTDEEMEKEYQRMIAAAKSAEAIKELKGSYYTEKAKLIGMALRMINKHIENSNSLLGIVRQTRKNINATQFQKQNITSGGEAPYFYSHHEVWLDKMGMIGRQVRNIKMKVASKARAQVTKNKLTGNIRTAYFNIHPSYGIDDTNSIIDFLIGTKVWKKTTDGIKNTLVKTLQRDDLVTRIESEPELLADTKSQLQEVWDEIEHEIKLKRKPRYE